MEKRLFLIDGSALAYRSYFAFINNPLRDSKGENTSAVFGYTNSLLKLLREEKPTHIGVCFDPPTPTFRHKKYVEYKATREKIPLEMRGQIPIIKEVTSAFGIPILEVEGYEADDVMGTLALQAQREGVTAVLVSMDKDFLQLVEEGILVYNPGRGGQGEGLYGREEVLKKYGVPPEKITDLFGLIGDEIDNVPGVPGVGMKTALPLLERFGSLEEVLKNVEKIEKRKLKENLFAFREQAFLSKDLVTIRTDVPIDLDLDALAYSQSDESKLREIFKRLEFYSLLKELVGSTPLQTENRRIIKREDLVSLCETLKKQIGFAIAVEKEKDEVTSSLLSFSYRHGESWSVEIITPEMRESVEQKSNQIQFSTPKNQNNAPFEVKMVLEELRPVLEDEEIWKVSDDLKSLLHFFHSIQLPFTIHHLPIRGSLFDTSIASYLLNPTRRDHTLLGQISHFLPLYTLGDSQGERASFLLQLKGVMEKEMERDGVLELFRDVEMKLVPVLFRMERNGVLIDLPFFQSLSNKLAVEIQKIEGEIFKIAGEEFNIRSPKQLRTILFEKLKLPRSKRTKTGYSTAVDVLEDLAHEHELPKRILEYREQFKLKSTYLDALPQLVHPETGRVHTTFEQTVTATGRLSSRDPNLQNIPIRGELGREIRKGFIAPPGSLLLSLDYSQIELRILAHLSGDENLIKGFQEGEDIHSITAGEVFQVPLEEMTPEVRNRAKAINYGIVYGLSPYGLSEQVGSSVEDAADFIALYFSTYPRVKEWIDRELMRARELGFTKTLLNRRRYIPEIRSRNNEEREFGERIAVNSPIQGTAADMIKIAMIEIDREIHQRRLKSIMILQIHDELVFEVPHEEVEEMKGLAKEKMENALPLKVPIVVDSGVGRNWFEAH